MGRWKMRLANFPLNGREENMRNVLGLENIIKEDFGAQPKVEFLIIQKIQRHGDIAMKIVHNMKV